MTVHGLSPEDARSPVRLDGPAFARAREASGALLEEAEGEIDRLFATVGRAGCCLLLTDSRGVALERRGAAGDDKDFRGIGLWSGTVWSEASVGTNGIGTALPTSALLSSSAISISSAATPGFPARRRRSAIIAVD